MTCPICGTNLIDALCSDCGWMRPEPTSASGTLPPPTPEPAPPEPEPVPVPEPEVHEEPTRPTKVTSKPAPPEASAKKPAGKRKIKE